MECAWELMNPKIIVKTWLEKEGKGIECLGSIWGDYSNTETTIVAALTTYVVTESAKILEIGNGVLMLHSLVGESVTWRHMK